MRTINPVCVGEAGQSTDCTGQTVMDISARYFFDVLAVWLPIGFTVVVIGVFALMFYLGKESSSK